MPPEARTVFLIARREFLTRVRSRIWVVGTVLLVLAMSGYILLQAKVLSASTNQSKVAFVGAAQLLAAPVSHSASTLGLKVIIKNVSGQAQGERLVNSGDLDALVSGTPIRPDVSVKEKLDPQLAGAISNAARQVAFDEALTAKGVSPAEVAAQVAGATPQVRTLDPGAAERSEREVAGVVVAILLYITLLIYGQVVAAGVVEEKANRIVEILLSTIRAWQLLMGKVLGIGLAGFIQLAAVGLAALFMAGRTHVINIPTIGISSVLSGLVWFVLGFILYALLYAAAASLVSRQEDLAAVTTPLSVLVVGTYLTFFWVIANPSSPAAATLAVLPPFAPILMPALIATGDVGPVQVILAAFLVLATIAGLTLLAARIYSNSVLRFGSRVTLRQAWSGRG